MKKILIETHKKIFIESLSSSEHSTVARVPLDSDGRAMDIAAEKSYALVNLIARVVTAYARKKLNILIRKGKITRK